MVSNDTESNKKIKLVLNKLLDEYNLGPNKTAELVLDFRDNLFFSGLGINRYDFLKIIEKLKEKEILSFYGIRKDTKIRHPKDDKQDFNICAIAIPLDFKLKTEDYLKELSNNNENLQSGLILYLEENGNLWHGNKSQNCYPMSTRGYRMKIIKFLVENKGVQETSFIASSLEKKEQNIRSEIGKIRAHCLSLTMSLKINRMDIELIQNIK